MSFLLTPNSEMKRKAGKALYSLVFARHKRQEAIFSLLFVVDLRSLFHKTIS
jgi:hypothetical protein